MKFDYEVATVRYPATSNHIILFLFLFLFSILFFFPNQKYFWPQFPVNTSYDIGTTLTKCLPNKQQPC